MHHIKLGHQNVQVGKIVCIGRNYVDHIKELGHAVPDKPVIFIKPASAIVCDGGSVIIPAYSGDCHHEVELAVLMGTTAKQISVNSALDHVAGYGVALDLTLRDVQAQQKEKGLPWEIAKCFDTSCPLSAFTPADRIVNPQNLQIELLVNGELRQSGNTSQMMRTVAELIAAASEYFTLESGDVLLTGTPHGVGRIVSGDRLAASIESVGHLHIQVA